MFDVTFYLLEKKSIVARYTVHNSTVSHNIVWWEKEMNVSISKVSLEKCGIIILLFWKIDVKPNRPFHLQ